eukprot:scaffold75_cov217-Pinguiococcus_pyrenoidosus.AAC.9
MLETSRRREGATRSQSAADGAAESSTSSRLSLSRAKAGVRSRVDTNLAGPRARSKAPTPKQQTSAAPVGGTGAASTEDADAAKEGEGAAEEGVGRAASGLPRPTPVGQVKSREDRAREAVERHKRRTTGGHAEGDFAKGCFGSLDFHPMSPRPADPVQHVLNFVLGA